MTDETKASTTVTAEDKPKRRSAPKKTQAPKQSQPEPRVRWKAETPIKVTKDGHQTIYTYANREVRK